MPRASIQVQSYLGRKLLNPGERGRWRREVDTSVAPTVQDVMRRLAQEDAGFSTLVCDGEQLCRGVLLLLNGKVVDWSQVRQHVLSDGDTLDVYPTVAGG